MHVKKMKIEVPRTPSLQFDMHPLHEIAEKDNALHLYLKSKYHQLDATHSPKLTVLIGNESHSMSKTNPQNNSHKTPHPRDLLNPPSTKPPPPHQWRDQREIIPQPPFKNKQRTIKPNKAKVKEAKKDDKKNQEKRRAKKTRESGHVAQNIPLQHRGVRSPVEVKAYICTTKVEEMNRALVVWGIQISNFTYDFSIPKGSNRLSDTNDSSFLLPLFCKLKPRAWSSKSSRNVESGVNPLILTVGTNVTLVGNATTVHSVEEILEKSTSLSREIDEYMDVQFFMQNVRGGPSGTSVREGSASSRKRKMTTSGIGNIILSSKNVDSLIRELCRKKRRDRDRPSIKVTLITIAPTIIPSPPISPITSLPPPRLTTDDAFGVIIDHGPLVVP
ncbi:hypothetical protein J1N35_004736 [Gossypium stocksii]|uniref:Uncharacterized protein n=1 Tax=Gossypium stocksii TaxID=47602 RepID=A0A9D3WCR6_9ROSI|nr:hypothetical protein J1N35_004736 [Gossypium stocksii]